MGESVSQLHKQFRLSEFAERLQYLSRSFDPIISHYQNTARIISESLSPLIESWQRWAEQNRKIFDSFDESWAHFQRIYRIQESVAIQILKKYKWFITPSLPSSFIFKVIKIGRQKGNQAKRVNALFVEYFSKSNYFNLKQMVLGWETNPLFRKRMKIFMDCLYALKSNHGNRNINPSNLILPILIANIDGLLTDYLASEDIKWDVSYDDFINKDSIKKVGRKSAFKSKRGQVMSTPLDELATDIFLNLLFQKSQPGKPLKTPFTFNRHKIMHGEYVNYGRIDNTIRAFLVLDFVFHVSS
jgi:hypothetical protein